MAHLTAFLGFGEVAQTFVSDQGWQGQARAYDIISADPLKATNLAKTYSDLGITGVDQPAELAVNGAAIFSVVTADQSIAAVESVRSYLKPRAWYFDFNSVAPDKKRLAAATLAERDVKYIDAAIMAPVQPASLTVPILVSGPTGEAAASHLRTLGFSNVEFVGEEIGKAATIKMIRSVLIKGVEALTAECYLAAHAAGCVEPVSQSLGTSWQEKANYNLDRMLVHGTRRAAEMREVCQTLDSLGVEPLLTEGTVQRQADLGRMKLQTPPDLLIEKLDLIREMAGGRVS